MPYNSRVLPALIAALCTLPAFAEPSAEHGRYLVEVAGCNDCHTAGYTVAADKIPQSAWLTGDNLGWNGPWGTSYASNLRLLLPKLSEDQWVQLARSANYRPPMPNRALHQMSEEDLRSIHRFVAQLGEAGHPAPAALPPGQEPNGPAVRFPAPPAP